jgi:hypothetical protein
MNKKKQARIIAHYLPQYHPIAENDEWWGKGFTEWTSVCNAKPLFKNHEQPKTPGELGFYDLRLQEAQEAQAQLAIEHGIEAFCYWHYWLGNGKRLLEMPFDKVLSSGKPDFPFCLGWANHSWKGVFFGAKGRTLIEQTYPSVEDHTNHFNYLLKAFRDPRYFRIDNKPLFLIYRPKDIPNLFNLTELWRELALKNGLPGLHLVGCQGGYTYQNPDKIGLDASLYCLHATIKDYLPRNRIIRKIKKNLNSFLSRPLRYQYKDAINFFLRPGHSPENEYPSIIPNWDNTPRLGKNGLVLEGSTPELFREHLIKTIDKIKHKKPENRIIFLKSWNEWAEGNYIEPDRKYKRSYLKVIKNVILGDELCPQGPSTFFQEKDESFIGFKDINKNIELSKSNEKLLTNSKNLKEIIANQRIIIKEKDILLTQMIKSHVIDFWQKLKIKSINEVYLYGSGKHTIWFLRLVENKKGPRIISIIDDNPKRNQISGHNIIKTNSLTKEISINVILSTDVHQEAMKRSLVEQIKHEMSIIDIYENILIPGPYPK